MTVELTCSENIVSRAQIEFGHDWAAGLGLLGESIFWRSQTPDFTTKRTASARDSGSLD